MDIYDAPSVETAHKVSLITRAEGAVSAESWQAMPYDDFLGLARRRFEPVPVSVPDGLWGRGNRGEREQEEFMEIGSVFGGNAHRKVSTQHPSRRRRHGTQRLASDAVRRFPSSIAHREFEPLPSA